jgi:hypothetical protein
MENGDRASRLGVEREMKSLANQTFCIIFTSGVTGLEEVEQNEELSKSLRHPTILPSKGLIKFQKNTIFSKKVLVF